MLSYAQQGRRGREEPPDSDGLASVAARGLWHACALLGCRAVIMAGMLYRKRHRHQGMRRVFCVLARGRLVEFDYPHAGRLASSAPEHLRAGCLSVLSSPSANAGSARLLFARSRTLALRRCYVVSRRADDLTTDDIMCEPWVMTDIGNYSGLRLADRLYADGTVSHDLIDDCIFTVWRPKAALPPPCYRVDASEREMVPASPRSSGDMQRPDVDGYASSESSAGRRGTVDDVRVGLEGRHSPRRMAVGSGVKKRLGVFKARSNAEMELWVTAINQEIRRMIESDEW
ncbi:hypothetical protein BX661DRAFT_177937 [Kickxella alabastrina]|uniref:uncharacterized protein n=1 Tax=Kickxella alabastrina TaxID=61397 RepID=UPI002220F96B|nr:uncharacterized protein BX661DRAFT_177937 [Kickxella alabastrina]KAI7833217.1 hypothetical protein BX661DRAFT_177937 [Kickxella alabastrina]